MRLKIVFKKENCCLPLNYQSSIQGLIYDSLSKEKEGKFYHEVGYGENKLKLFVFSSLIGKKIIDFKNRKIYFEDEFVLYISSEDERFLQILFNYFNVNKKVVLANQVIDIARVDILSLRSFKGIKEVEIYTLSPIVTYTTENNFVTYFAPSDDDFEELVKNNLEKKFDSIGIKKDVNFKITKVISEKSHVVKFKNTTYKGYTANMIVEVDSPTLSLLYNTGMSSKGSAGFGMIEVKK
ncbi:MAG TPA: CRISPR-associated endoribonuclease Cas6 [Erysipelotrichaceae bacterium]|nr:CRISPR-associated endoribonuclease Cas6 [Erysipelotrichaceae bacterium]